MLNLEKIFEETFPNAKLENSAVDQCVKNSLKFEGTMISPQSFE